MHLENKSEFPCHADIKDLIKVKLSKSNVQIFHTELLTFWFLNELTLFPHFLFYCVQASRLLDEVIDELRCFFVCQLGITDTSTAEQILQVRVKIVGLEGPKVSVHTYRFVTF